MKNSKIAVDSQSPVSKEIELDVEVYDLPEIKLIIRPFGNIFHISEPQYNLLSKPPT